MKTAFQSFGLFFGITFLRQKIIWSEILWLKNIIMLQKSCTSLSERKVKSCLYTWENLSFSAFFRYPGEAGK